MSRKPDPLIREEIVEKVLLALSQCGLNNLSLRDIAQKVGISARMLLYYFDSFDNLLNATFIQMSKKHKSALHALISSVYVAENKKPLLLFVELYTRGLRDIKKHEAFFEEVLHNWIETTEAVIAPKFGIQSKAYATMIVSFFRGLMLDWLATEDTDRIHATSKVFADTLDLLSSAITKRVEYNQQE
jgi:AcrR family transcriptional regulator